jgi:hypothetical protein
MVTRTRRSRGRQETTAANTLEYKGCVGVVEYDDDAGIFHGEVINLRDVIGSKLSDENNPDMYLTDNLGNHYSFIGLGGFAAKRVKLHGGVTYPDAFTFPPAKPGADTFTFHDSDNGVVIANMHLETPSIAI